MAVIIFMLLCSIKISTTHGSKECNPSWCGNQYIGNPFTLEGDPSNCTGDENYKLTCIGNKTFMRAPYDKYLVTDIFYNNYTINIVDSDLASGKCNLPSQAITPSFFPKGFYLPRQRVCNRFPKGCYLTSNFGFVGFINCSKEPDRNFSGAAIPCLSQNNKFIYLVEDGWIDSLGESCSYLTMVPIPWRYDYLYKIGDDIFGIMKNGFSISWAYKKPSGSEIIHYCLTQAVPIQTPLQAFSNGVISSGLEVHTKHVVNGSLVRAKQYTHWLNHFDRIKFLLEIEFEFIYCVRDSQDSIIFGSSIVFAVFIDIIFLYLAMIIAGRLIIAPLCILVFLLYELLKMLSPIDYIEIFLRNQQRTTLTRYMYTDIVAMTRHFKDKLGQGGFGTVYKGELPGDYLVAVKLLGTSNDNGEDFISEVSTIGTIHHTNVVRLIGFCSEGLHRALVYEYMYNGSLDKYIFSSTQKFTTKKLTEIALGVARGIDYLHRGCDMRILHFDIKPQNILLDGNFNPKVSDFGLAKLYSKDNSLVSTFAARGTIGYMAPELISRSFGLISYKSDVYSFGMLLLEMAGGRRNYDSRVENSSEAYYPSWIYDRLNKQTNLKLLDHNVETVDVEMKLCKVGLWCIQMSPSSRPTMLRVIEMLEGNVEDVEMPPKPFFFSSSDHITRGQNSFQLSSNEISTIYESE